MKILPYIRVEKTPSGNSEAREAGFRFEVTFVEFGRFLGWLTGKRKPKANTDSLPFAVIDEVGESLKRWADIPVIGAESGKVYYSLPRTSELTHFSLAEDVAIGRWMGQKKREEREREEAEEAALDRWIGQKDREQRQREKASAFMENRPVTGFEALYQSWNRAADIVEWERFHSAKFTKETWESLLHQINERACGRMIAEAPAPIPS